MNIVSVMGETIVQFHLATNASGNVNKWAVMQAASLCSQSDLHFRLGDVNESYTYSVKDENRANC